MWFAVAFLMVVFAAALAGIYYGWFGWQPATRDRNSDRGDDVADKGVIRPLTKQFESAVRYKLNTSINALAHLVLAVCSAGTEDAHHRRVSKQLSLSLRPLRAEIETLYRVDIFRATSMNADVDANQRVQWLATHTEFLALCVKHAKLLVSARIAYNNYARNTVVRPLDEAVQYLGEVADAMTAHYDNQPVTHGQLAAIASYIVRLHQDETLRQRLCGLSAKRLSQFFAEVQNMLDLSKPVDANDLRQHLMELAENPAFQLLCRDNVELLAATKPAMQELPSYQAGVLASALKALRAQVSPYDYSLIVA